MLLYQPLAVAGVEARLHLIEVDNTVVCRALLLGCTLDVGKSLAARELRHSKLYEFLKVGVADVLECRILRRHFLNIGHGQRLHTFGVKLKHLDAVFNHSADFFYQLNGLRLALLICGRVTGKVGGRALFWYS
ncbi:unknown [Prevotella sp. CAG:873]|nr:unknown [Prevotella sp. CAG:873]